MPAGPGKIFIKQYAYGLMRIDDATTIKKFITQKVAGGGSGGKIVIGGSGAAESHYVAFGVTTDKVVNGQIQPAIYLPPRGALVLNGEDIPVQPLQGGQQAGQTLYLVPPNTDLWCAVTMGGDGKRVARLYKMQDLPKVSDFAFHVALVPLNLRRSKVVQYVYGTVFAYAEKGSFSIIDDGYNITPITPPLSATSRDIDSDDSSDSSEEEPEETPWDDYDPEFYNTTHHFENGYYMMGGVLKEITIPDTLKVESFAGQFVCLKVPATTNSNESATIVGYDGLAAVQAAQQDPAYFVKPLYKIDANGKVEADLRDAPVIQVAEVL